MIKRITCFIMHKIEKKYIKKQDWSLGQCPKHSMGVRLSRKQRAKSYLLNIGLPSSVMF